jgi:hypothetical protein
MALSNQESARAPSTRLPTVKNMRRIFGSSLSDGTSTGGTGCTGSPHRR